MNKKTLIPLFVGLGMGLLALKLGYDYLEEVKHAAGRKVVITNKIVMAAGDLPAAHLIGPKDVMLYDIPKSAMVPGLLTNPQEAVGKTLKVSIVKFMPIRPEMLTRERGFASLIPKGYMAVSVRVDEYSGVAGFLSPGNRVVVLGTFGIQKGQKTQMVTKTVLDNIQVRAVGSQYWSNFNIPDSALPPVTSVTLLVTPEQAEKLQLAMEAGKTYLAMETGKGSRISAPPILTLTELLEPNESQRVPMLKGARRAIAEETEAHPAFKEGATKDRPYLVEVVGPNTLEKIYFSSSSSDLRVLPPVENKPAPMNKVSQPEPREE